MPILRLLLLFLLIHPSHHRMFLFAFCHSHGWQSSQACRQPGEPVILKAGLNKKLKRLKYWLLTLTFLSSDLPDENPDL